MATAFDLKEDCELSMDACLMTWYDAVQGEAGLAKKDYKGALRNSGLETNALHMPCFRHPFEEQLWPSHGACGIKAKYL